MTFKIRSFNLKFDRLFKIPNLLFSLQIMRTRLEITFNIICIIELFIEHARRQSNANKARTKHISKVIYIKLKLLVWENYCKTITLSDKMDYRSVFASVSTLSVSGTTSSV